MADKEKERYEFKIVNEPHNYTAVWLNIKGTQGWAAEDEGAIIKYDGKEWKEFHKAGEITRSDLSAFWMSEDGKEGWAVDRTGYKFI